MHWDVANPTTNPYGKFYLYQANPYSDVLISGWMKQMPPTNPSFHGFSINRDPWDGQACASCGPHFNPTSEWHGPMNGSPSHVGDLTALWANAIGDVNGYSAVAQRPTMWGPYSILGRSMVAYADPDDTSGANDESLIDGNMGLEIACCKIRPYKILVADEVDYAYAKVSPDGRGRMLGDAETDYYTADEFRELYGISHEDVDDLFDEL